MKMRHRSKCHGEALDQTFLGTASDHHREMFMHVSNHKAMLIQTEYFHRCSARPLTEEERGQEVYRSAG